MIWARPMLHGLVLVEGPPRVPVSASDLIHHVKVPARDGHPMTRTDQPGDVHVGRVAETEDQEMLGPRSLRNPPAKRESLAS